MFQHTQQGVRTSLSDPFGLQLAPQTPAKALQVEHAQQKSQKTVKQRARQVPKDCSKPTLGPQSAVKNPPLGHRVDQGYLQSLWGYPLKPKITQHVFKKQQEL